MIISNHNRVMLFSNTKQKPVTFLYNVLCLHVTTATKAKWRTCCKNNAL